MAATKVTPEQMQSVVINGEYSYVNGSGYRNRIKVTRITEFSVFGYGWLIANDGSGCWSKTENREGWKNFSKYSLDK